jgi:voltage-gated potassium channel Kch
MLVTFSFAFALISATVVIQALFMSFGLHVFRWLAEHRPMAMIRNPTIAIVIWIGFLIIPIVLNVHLWAAFYYVQAALPNYEESLYFSIVTFTTLGYGDIVLDREWRLLATFEAINGTIIFGWMTALIVAFIQRMWGRVR